jgi:ureidoacrylate peracid hydrolase
MAVDVFSAKKIDGQVQIDPGSTAILIIDMLNEFCKPGGAMVLPGSEALLGPLQRLIAAGRKAGCPIVFLVDSHRPNVRQDRE